MDFAKQLDRAVDALSPFVDRMVAKVNAIRNRSIRFRDGPTKAIAKARVRSRNRVRDKIARASRRHNLRTGA